MKRNKYISALILFITLSICNFCFGQSSSDTISTRIDTIFCVSVGDTVTLASSLDTSQYDFIWSSNFEFSDTLSRQNFLILLASDTFIRKSIPRDTLPLIIDTIYAKLHLIPVIDIIQPPLDCYNGKPIIITSNSVYDTSYSNEIISFYDLGNSPLPGITPSKNGNMYEVILMNGDTIRAKLIYNTVGCTAIDTIFDIGIRFTPELQFDFSKVCFGDSTTILNLSNFEESLSDVDISIEGINQNFTSKNNFNCFIDGNDNKRDVFVQINQQGCISRDTLEIYNLLKPTVAFDFRETCENEFQVLDNQSTETTPNYSVLIEVDNKTYNFSQGTSYTLSDTLPDKIYTFKMKLTNSNGCMDTCQVSQRC